MITGGLFFSFKKSLWEKSRELGQWKKELEMITPSDDESVKLLANVPSWVEKSQLSLRVLEDWYSITILIILHLAPD